MWYGNNNFVFCTPCLNSIADITSMIVTIGGIDHQHVFVKSAFEYAYVNISFMNSTAY